MLLGHTASPAALLAATAALTAAGCALAGALPASGGALAVWPWRPGPCAYAVHVAAPRRAGGGRLPLGVLEMANSDPSGRRRALVAIGWILLWPVLAALAAGGPVALVGHAGARDLRPPRRSS